MPTELASCANSSINGFILMNVKQQFNIQQTSSFDAQLKYGRYPTCSIVRATAVYFLFQYPDFEYLYNSNSNVVESYVRIVAVMATDNRANAMAAGRLLRAWVQQFDFPSFLCLGWK
jgi:hypothetical protein